MDLREALSAGDGQGVEKPKGSEPGDGDLGLTHAASILRTCLCP